MKRILFSLFILTLAFAETILIPEDFATIQEGIDASVDGDGIVDMLDIVQIVNYILNN